MTPDRAVFIDYTNHRGERSIRKVTPLSVRFAATEHHPEVQWLLGGWCHLKGAPRSFAMKDIHAWYTEEPHP